MVSLSATMRSKLEVSVEDTISLVTLMAAGFTVVGLDATNAVNRRGGSLHKTYCSCGSRSTTGHTFSTTLLQASVETKKGKCIKDWLNSYSFERNKLAARTYKAACHLAGVLGSNPASYASPEQLPDFLRSPEMWWPGTLLEPKLLDVRTRELWRDELIRSVEELVSYIRSAADFDKSVPLFTSGYDPEVVAQRLTSAVDEYLNGAALTASGWPSLPATQVGVLASKFAQEELNAHPALRHVSSESSRQHNVATEACIKLVASVNAASTLDALVTGDSVEVQQAFVAELVPSKAKSVSELAVDEFVRVSKVSLSLLGYFSPSERLGRENLKEYVERIVTDECKSLSTQALTSALAHTRNCLTLDVCDDRLQGLHPQQPVLVWLPHASEYQILLRSTGHTPTNAQLSPSSRYGYMQHARCLVMLPAWLANVLLLARPSNDASAAVCVPDTSMPRPKVIDVASMLDVFASDVEVDAEEALGNAVRALVLTSV